MVNYRSLGAFDRSHLITIRENFWNGYTTFVRTNVRFHIVYLYVTIIIFENIVIKLIYYYAYQ